MLNRQTARRVYAIDISAVILVFAIVAAAGPTWSRGPNPFFTETSPLVIALNVDETMLTNDIQPTRLERAKLKILDLLAFRSGARTALIAYAGSAHMVLPLTEDAELLKPFLDGLAPDIMPSQGHNTGSALELAQTLLAAETTPGSILFITDGVEDIDIPEFAAYTKREDAKPLVALVVGSYQGGNIRHEDGSVLDGPAIDRVQIERWQSAGRVSAVDIRADDDDVRQIERIVASNLRASLDNDERSQWLDRGWWLLWPALLLTLFSFRRGWTMAW